MATSDVWTTEDIDALDTVIQLKPHQKDIEFTTVTKTSDDKDLVSLDELYEKTGQEAIGKIIDGFNSLIKHNKLKREHGVLLKVNGAESWMELPDRMNAVKGGEYFVGNIVDGFIKIVLAIIKFIKGICAWIFTRLKSLLGFAKTKEEVKFLYEKNEWFKQEVAKVIGQLNIHGFDPDEFVKELPDNMMPSDMLKVVKSKFVKVDDVIAQYEDCFSELVGLDDRLAKVRINLDAAQKRYQEIMRSVSAAIRDRSLNQGNVVTIKKLLVELAQQYFDPTDFKTAYKNFAVKFYGINETRLGVDGNIKALKEKIANEVDFTTIKYDKALYTKSTSSVKTFMKNLDKTKVRNFDKSDIEKLENFASKGDAELIKRLAELSSDKELYSVFLTLVNMSAEYTAIIQSTIEIVQESEKTLTSLSKLYTKTGAIICALTTNDLSKISASLDALSEKDRAAIEKNDPNFKIFYFETLNQMFYKEHPDGHIEKRVSDAIAGWLSTPVVSKFMKSFNNYARGVNQ